MIVVFFQLYLFPAPGVVLQDLPVYLVKSKLSRKLFSLLSDGQTADQDQDQVVGHIRTHSRRSVTSKLLC